MERYREHVFTAVNLFFFCIQNLSSRYPFESFHEFHSLIYLLTYCFVHMPIPVFMKSLKKIQFYVTHILHNFFNNLKYVRQWNYWLLGTSKVSIRCSIPLAELLPKMLLALFKTTFLSWNSHKYSLPITFKVFMVMKILSFALWQYESVRIGNRHYCL